MNLFGRLAAGAACAALFACLPDCGGGGGSQPAIGAITPAAPVRTDLLFGYYADCPTCAMETRDHTNLYWASNFNGLPGTMESLFNARAAGFTNVVLAVPAYTANPEADVRFYLDSLRDGGFLVNVKALYPLDEPDVAGKSAAEVAATNAMLRRVMAGYPELAATALAVIYGAGRTWPGIESYDWVGFDDYTHGCAIQDTYADLKNHLTAAQRILLVPGGADPWRQDPACFMNKANADAQVVAVVPFLWIDTGGNAGIRSNPTRRLYCEAGRLAIGNPAACP